MSDAAIIIPTLNTKALTLACVDSVLANSVLDHEIVVVDGGSGDGTVGDLQRRGMPGLLVLSLRKNLGYAGACNAGAELVKPARAYIFLNSDCIVTAGWDEILVNGLGATNGTPIAATGPMSNCVSGCQMDPEAACRTPAELAAYAALKRQRFGGQVHTVDRLTGMCLCISAAAWAEVGRFDDRYWPGNFDDDDWGWRAKEKGYALGLCPGAFVHHVGQATFRANGIDYGAALAENLHRFEEKWRTARAGPWADLHS